MNPELKQRWKEAYTLLWQTVNAVPSMNFGPGGRQYRKLTRENMFDRAFESFEAAGAETWEAGRKAFLRDNVSMRMRKDQSLPRDALAIKLLRMGLLAARGEHGHLPRHERKPLDDAAPRLRWFEPATAPASPQDADVSPGETLMVETAFAWRQEPRRGVFRGIARASTLIPLHGVSPLDAPVVMKVANPEGGWLDIRRLGDDWLRPVLEPGAWRPCKTPLFLEAMRDGVAWRDSPMGAGRNGPDRWGTLRDDPILSLDECSDPVPYPVAEESRAIAEHEAEIRNACAGIVVIDGVVWRRTTEPVAFNAVVKRQWTDPERDDEIIYVAAWKTDDLTSIESQETTTSDWRHERVGRNEVEVTIESRPHMERLIHDMTAERNLVPVSRHVGGDEGKRDRLIERFATSPRPLFDRLGEREPAADFQDALDVLIERVRQAAREEEDAAETDIEEWNKGRSARRAAMESFKSVEAASASLSPDDRGSMIRAAKAISEFVELSQKGSVLVYCPGVRSLARALAKGLAEADVSPAPDHPDEDAIANGFLH